MKIGFDISQTGRHKAGCGYFADSLIQALTRLDAENAYILLPHFGTTFWDPDAEHGTRRINLPNVSRKRIGRDFARAMAFWTQLPTDALQRLGNPDIVHCNNYFCPRGIDVAKVVYTLYDLSFLEYPEFTTEENRVKCFRGVFDAAMYADFVISISQFSRTKFLETFPHYPADRVQVVSLGSRFTDESFDGNKIHSIKGLYPERFWLTVGTLEPRKNLRRLLSAFSDYVAQSEVVHPLALAGGNGWLEEDLVDFIDSLGISNYVRILGYVSDQELLWLYRYCFSFVYPSLYEGFGLPVLEAMGQGAAVVTSTTTSLPEVAGDAAHLIDPMDTHSLTEAFSKLNSDSVYRERLKKRALVQAKKYSWDKAATDVLHFYERVMDLPKWTGP